MIYYFLLPPINALLLNLNEGLLEHLLTNVGVLGNVKPLSPLSSECLLPLNVDVLPSKWSPLGDDATIDVTPLLGVTLPGYDDGGIDGGGIIDVDWWCLILDSNPRELLGLSLGAIKFAVDIDAHEGISALLALF